MGKSDKKVKSDRINSLRKQYDAFLEEDKKRKERNEYILGKLNKMRHVSAVVPLRHKSNIHVVESRSPVAYNRSVFIPENSLRNDIQLSRPNVSHLQLDIPRNCLEESPLIHEISKKYILIPRIKPTLTNDYVIDINQSKNQIHDSTDWKSKYDILERLKKNEKEEQADKYEVSSPEHFSESCLNKEPTSNRKHDDDFNLNKYQLGNDELILNYRNELPEKDLSDRKLYYESEGVKKYKNNEKEILTASVQESSMKNEILTVNEEILDKKLQNTPQDYEDFQKSNNLQGIIYDTNLDLRYLPTEEAKMKSSEDTEIKIVDTNIESECSPKIEPTTYKELPVEEEKSNTEDSEKKEKSNTEDSEKKEKSNTEDSEKKEKSFTEDSEKVVLQDGLSSAQILNTYNLVKDINDEVPLTEELISPKNLESPNEIINSQEFTLNEDVTLKADVNMNPEEYLASQRNLDPSNQYESQTPTVPVDTTGIKELDADQKGMFYSENTDANYAYNQESVENPYNAQYPPESENYQQNEEYAYYEGTQPDQTYPVEINEQEESPERYDQTYEQQYANFEQHDYEQQNYVQQQEGYEQQPQQYEQNSTAFESYGQAEQELDQPQYEQDQNYDSNEPVEQQFDNEQGFVEEEKIERDESVAQDNPQVEQELAYANE